MACGEDFRAWRFRAYRVYDIGLGMRELGHGVYGLGPGVYLQPQMLHFNGL